MDAQSIANIVLALTAIIGVLWAGYERITSRRAANADLTDSATGLVGELRTFYTTQIEQLKLEHRQLSERVTRLEGMLEQYGCHVLDCPLRQPFHLQNKKT